MDRYAGLVWFLFTMVCRKSEPNESSKTFNKEKNVYYKKTKANTEVIALGRKIINAMNDEEFGRIRSKSDTLHFNQLLGLASKKTTRKVKTSYGTEIIDCSTPIGVMLKTDIDIEVPYLKDVTKNKNTGIDPIEDIEYKSVKAGEYFDLTLYEFMYLIIRDEYGGYLKVDGKDFYAHLSVKLPAFIKGKAKLPTPTINFEKGNGSARASILDIDTYIEDKWVIIPQFERFAPLVRNRGKRS
jgi:hypothetical protein